MFPSQRPWPEYAKRSIGRPCPRAAVRHGLGSRHVGEEARSEQQHRLRAT